MAFQIVRLPLGPLQTNCYLLACSETGHAAIIDPGWSGRSIAEQVRTHGWIVTDILLTHAHFDHVGGLSEVKELTNAPVSIHRDAISMLDYAPAAAALWGFHIDPPPSADRYIEDGDILSVGHLRLEVLLTPGHAPGHVCFYLAQEGYLFDGDVLFQGSIGRTDLPGGDYALLMTSIRERLMVLPDATIVLPGHGDITTIGEERRHNPFILGDRGLDFA